MAKAPQTAPGKAERDFGQSDHIDRVIAGRFRIQRLLGKSFGTETLLGADLADDGRVVVKFVDTDGLSPGTRAHLEREASLRRNVKGRWLPQIIHTEWDRDELCVVMPFVSGTSLKRRLGSGPLEVQEALSLGRCLFSALRELHEHGMLHRDVKPANIIVEQKGLLTGATLVDFGLARSLQVDESLRNQPLESVRYTSPELAGCINRDVGNPSDLYSAGVVLFESLAGRIPFTGETVGAILYEHMTTVVPLLGTLGLEIPRALDELIQRLLRKDPSARYQSAEAVLDDLAAIGWALQSGGPDPQVVLGLSDRRSTLIEPAFVARRRELKQLDDTIESTHAGGASLVLMEGESGRGKSRLLFEATQRGIRKGCLVLTGHGSSEVGQRPLQLLDGVVREFLVAVRSDPALARSVQTGLDTHLEPLIAAVPKLSAVLGRQGSNPAAQESFGEARTVQALSAFFDALGTGRRPVLVLLDDCQWADELAVKAIRHWNDRRREAGTSAGHVTVMAAFRSEEVSEDHQLREIPPSVHLRLSHLDEGEIRQLANSMAGRLPEQALELVCRLSEGIPFMASAVLRGLVESGVLVSKPGGWDVEAAAMADVQSSSHAASLLSRRIELLTPKTIELLSIGAVLGKKFDVHTVAEMAQRSDVEAITALDEARRRNLVWLQPDGSHYVFVHDRIRSAVIDRMTADQRQELHRRAASHIQKRTPQRASDLAYHFDAAGRSEVALQYALRAAEQARARYSLEVAEQQYRIAQRGAGSAEPATRYRIAEGLGDVLMLRGRYDDAGPFLERAARLAQGNYEKAHIRGKLGELASKRGDKERAVRDAVAALETLGRRVPRRTVTFLACLAWEAVIQVLHTALPWLFAHRRMRLPSKETRLQLRLHGHLAIGYWFTSGKIRTLWTHLRGMNLGERYLPTLELAHAYSDHAPVISLVGMFGRAIRYAHKSLQIRRSFGDLWGEGQSLGYYGCVLYYASRHRECVKTIEDSVRLLERTGDYWQLHIARYQSAAAFYRLGDFRRAFEQARRNYDSGLEVGDEQASGIILDVWARVTNGKVPEEALKQEAARDRPDAQGRSQVMLAEGVHLLCNGDLDQAVEVLEEAVRVADKKGICNAYTIPSLAWLATAYRLKAERDIGCTLQQRRGYLRQAEAAARRVIRVAVVCKNDLPHALREYALALSMRGKHRRARRALKRALAVAERQNARHERKLILRVFSQLEHKRGQPEVQPQPPQAEAVAAEPPAEPPSDESGAFAGEAPVTLSLADRFHAVIDSGRRIASALYPDKIYAQTQEALVQLFRGENCLVVETDRSGGRLKVTPVQGQVPDGFDEQMVDRAQRAGHVMSFNEGGGRIADDGPASSVELSTLCAPVFVRRRGAACLCVTHRHVQRMFGTDEERLADFVATIAGAALENAEGFDKLRRQNETLEQQVNERTAAAEARTRELELSNRKLERVARELRETEAQLRVSVEEAEAANRAKSRFLAAMSHEVRTPMNGMIGMAKLALTTSLTSQQRQYLDNIGQSANALLRILNDMLDFSKMEAGKVHMEKIPFELWEVVEDALMVLSPSASAKNLELTCRIAPDVPRRVYGDPGRLRQIAINLVNNAIKFTERGEISVHVCVETTAQAGTHVHFSVSDTGIGIPADKHELIFESFSQSDSSITRRFGGTGLGLAICSELVDLMGGKIWVESEVGQGSTFHFVVGLDTADETPAWDCPDDGLDGVSVLIVDDNETARLACEELLTRYGANTTTTDSGEAAISLMNRAFSDGTPFQVAVVDAIMPGIDGWTLSEKLSADPKLKQCPIVLLLPAASSSDPVQPKHSGVVRLLTKPARSSELVDTVRRAAGVLPDDAIRGSDERPEQAPHALDILLAEDSPVNQEIAVGLLELRGHRVEAVDNGAESIAALEKKHYDVVLMDVEMPVMDGLAATRIIREMENRGVREFTPIIAMTAHATAESRQECMDAGMDGYLSKPIQPMDLYRLLESTAASAAELRNSAHACAEPD